MVGLCCSSIGYEKQKKLKQTAPFDYPTIGHRIDSRRSFPGVCDRRESFSGLDNNSDQMPVGHLSLLFNSSTVDFSTHQTQLDLNSVGGGFFWGDNW